MSVSQGGSSRNRPFFVQISSFLAFLALAVFLAPLTYAKGVPVLCYHQVAEAPKSSTAVSTAAFKEQVAYLAERGFRAITLAELAKSMRKGVLPEKCVVITVDDGDRSLHAIVWPVMKQFKFPFSAYVYTSRVGSRGGVSKEQLVEMAAGGVEIGSHTKTHPHLTPPKKPKSWKRLTAEQVREELTGSKVLLEKWIGRPVLTLAYPFGLYNKEIELMAIESGYEAMAILDGRKNRLDDSPYRIRRTMVTRSTTFEQFKRIVE